MTTGSRPKIIGIGYPKFAVAEFKELEKAYDIHHFVPTDRAQVISEIKRIVEEQGPFDAGYVVSAVQVLFRYLYGRLKRQQLFGTAAYSPFHPDMLGPIFDAGQCGIWAQGGAGYDDVDVPYLTSKNAWFSNTPYAVTEATADMGILLMLNTLRGSYEYEQLLRSGQWRGRFGLTEDPTGKTIGFIGMGAIGKSMALKTKPWGMKVIYNKRTRLSAEG